MSKLTKILFLCFILIFLFSSVCFATDATTISENTETQEEHIHDQAETTNEDTEESTYTIMNTDLYIADDTLVIDDIVNGNAFVYGNEVTISGQIYGDLFIAGNTINIEEVALITGNLFAFGSNITYNGKAGDVYAFAENFTMGENSYINRDLKLYAPTFSLNGSIQKDVYMAFSTISVPTNVSTIILGNVYYASQEESTQLKDFVAGDIEFTPITASTPTAEEILTQYITTFINVILYALVIILLSVFFTSKFADKATYCLKKRAFASAGVGILAFVIIPFLSVFLMISGFLSYAGIALLTIYILMLSITISILGIAIGNLIADKLANKTKGKVILFSLVSVTVIWLLQQIPIVGIYVSLFTVVFGFGLLLVSFFMRKNVSETQTIIEEKN